MKRNENLKTLSWEHHDGLVVSFRLQQGLKKNAKTDEMCKYILHIWNGMLENHFRQEEQVITLKLMQSEKGIEFLNQMLNEHETIRKLINKIDSHKSDFQVIEEFALLLNQHIRFEERQLFPLFEQEAGSEKLQEVGRFLKEHHNPSCEVWPSQFWRK
jgi:hemerythrin-like domain-containing protein